MDPEDEMTALSVKMAEEEEVIQHGLAAAPLRMEPPSEIVKENGQVRYLSSEEIKKKGKRFKMNEDILNISMLMTLYILQGLSQNTFKQSQQQQKISSIWHF